MGLDITTCKRTLRQIYLHSDPMYTSKTTLANFQKNARTNRPLSSSSSSSSTSNLTPLPKPPTHTLILPPPTPSPHSQEVNRYPRRHKPNHNQRLHRFRDHRSSQQEQAHTTKDNWRRDPCFIRSFQIGFSNPEDDQAQDCKEVECIPCHTVECNEGSEFAESDVD